MSQATDDLGQFFDYFWRDTEAYVYTPVDIDGTWKPFMFRWPRGRANIIQHTLKHAADPGAQVYFSPALFKATTARKEGVLGSWTLWADYDGNAPQTWPTERPAEGKLWVPPPTMRVQSSLPGHEHVYWRLSEFMVDINRLEDRNRAIAKVTGADSSGWDADQVLRPIHTLNRKREPASPVVILKWEV